MEIDFSIILVTILNLILLCGIIYLIIRFFTSISNIKKQNDNINRKLDNILDLIEKSKIN